MKKVCNWNEATDPVVFDDVGSAKEYTRSKMHEFNILSDADLTPENFLRGARFDFSSAMASTLSPKMRKMGTILVRDATPKKGNTNYVREEAASEVKDSLLDGFIYEYAVTHEVLGKKWLREQKNLKENPIFKGGASFNALQVRNIFNDLVGKKIAGRGIAVNEVGYTSKESRDAVDKMAALQSAIHKKQLDMIKLAGVEGAEEIADNANYLTRQHSAIKQQQVMADPTRGREYLKKFYVDAMEDGMLKGKKQKPLTPVQKELIAENLIEVVRRGRSGVNPNIIVSSMAKRETFRRTLEEFTDMTADEIVILLDKTFKVMPNASTGGSSYLRRRIKFNEAYTDGRTNFSDLVENNAEALYQNYSTTVSGDLALAYKGIKSRGDFARFREEILKDYASNPKIAQPGFKGRLAQWQMKNEIQALDMAYAFLKGRPLAEDPGGLVATALRFVRKLNYSRSMGQVGFANMSEAGNVAGLFGWKETMRQVPNLRKIMKRLENGKREDLFIRELDETLGAIGNHSILQQVTNRIDDFGGDVVSDGITTFENKLDRLNRFTNTYSGQFMSTSAMQVLTVSQMTQVFGRFAIGEGSTPFSKKIFGKERMSPEQIDARFRDIGIAPKMLERILKEFKTHSKFTKGEFGSEITLTNFNKWEADTHSAYILAMRRIAHRVVQQADIGEKAYFGYLKSIGMNADGHLGQIAYQFRSFMFSSWAKQFLYGLKMRDAIVFDQFMNSMLWGGLMFVGQTQIAGIAHPNKEEYYKRRMAPETIAKAAFQRAAFASLLPIGANLINSAFSDNPIFGYRTSGLDSNIITGNPTYSLIFQKLIPTMKAVSQSTFNSDRAFSKADANKAIGIIPHQNIIGLQQLLRAITSGLPESREQ